MCAATLRQEFKCEICGGQSYWGRRAFERHFKEWRHQNGMRALGIPNTKTFFEVTQMKDALELWASIKVSQHPAHTGQLFSSAQTSPGMAASALRGMHCCF